MSRPSLALLLTAAVTLCLAACGGGGSAGSSTAASTAAAYPHTPSAAELAAARRKAGAAAPFVKAAADNSVPTFGAEASASQRGRAEADLRSYLQARTKADWPTVCRDLATSTREGLEKLAKSSSGAKARGCAPILAALSKGVNLSNPLTGPLLSLRVAANNAFALFYGPHRRQYIVPMAREGNAWRPTQTAPIAYPPGASPTTTP